MEPAADGDFRLWVSEWTLCDPMISLEELRPGSRREPDTYTVSTGILDQSHVHLGTNMSEPPRLTLLAFYGISSPWAYFGAERLAAIAKKHNAKLIHRPIRVIQANGGIPLRTRPDSRQKYHEVELARWRAHLDMPLNLKPKYYPCRTIETAAQAVIALQRAGVPNVDAFSFAVQRALWAEDRDIADLETLREIARATGLGEDAVALIVEPQTAEVVAEWEGNLAEAEQRGIFGTPTYVVDDELFWGQDRLDFVDRALGAAKAKLEAKVEKMVQM